MSRFWRNWLEMRRIWWVQLLYVILLLASYGLFGYVLACIWILEYPTLLQILLITAGSVLGTAAILISLIDCVLMCCRKSEMVLPTVLEPIPIQLPTAQTPNPMLVPRKKPLGRTPLHIPIPTNPPLEQEHV